MVKISILYPSTPDATFDMEYYLRTHVPGPQSELPPSYVAMCHYTFTTAEDLVAAFMPHAAVLQGDIANYTTIAPIVQFSAVEIAESR